MLQRSLRGLANAIGRRPVGFLIAGVLLAVAAAWYTQRALELKTSRNDLIGRDSEYWRLYSAYAREFRGEEDYIVLVESSHPARNRTGVDALVKALLARENNPGAADAAAAQQFSAADVFYRVDFTALQPWFLSYLGTNDLVQIRDSLQDFKQLLAILQHRPRVDTFFDAMNQMLGQLGGAPVAERRKMEAFLPTISGLINQMAAAPTQSGDGAGLLSPWASAFFSADMLGEAEQQMKWQGYQTFRDGHMFLVLIHPTTGPAVSHETTIPKLRRIMAGVREQFPDLQIGLTGEPVLDFDEMAESERDAAKATIMTLILVGVLFALSFREVLRPLLAVVGMMIVLALSMGYATLSVGHLNILTVAFAVMILGLGIDLEIQFLARYEEELSKKAGRAAAVATAIQRTGRSIVTAGVTNAAAFFAMALSGFRGVIELGIIAGGGMLIATIATLTVLPAMLLLVRRNHEATSIPAQAAATRFERFLLRRPAASLVGCAVVTVAALLVGWRVRFDYNVLNLQSRRADSVKTERRLLEADVESSIFGAVVCDTFAETRALQNRLSKLPTVAAVHSIAELVPEDQEQKLPIVQAIKRELGDVRFDHLPLDPDGTGKLLHSLGLLRLKASQLVRDAATSEDETSVQALAPLVKAAQEARTKLQAVDPAQLGPRLGAFEQRFFLDLESQLRLLATQSDRPMTVEDVPLNVRRMLVGKTGKFLVRIFPRQNIWERQPLTAFVHEVQQLAPQVTGTPLGLYEFVDVLMRGYRNAALWALLVIVILIFIDFRGGYATLLTILPLLVGLAWMLGAMSLLHIPFNPANIMVLPLMVGIGVAYGIYVVQRYREDGDAAFYSKSTGRAVVLSALVTIVAFGSLIIGAHRGIRSLGLVMSIGVGACLVAALVLLPALLEIARRKRWKV